MNLITATRPARQLVLHGDALDQMSALPSASIHAVVTSPPYYKLRHYGTEPVIWGGETQCVHRWGTDRFCRCGAWLGELGLEPTVGLYTKHMVEVFRQIRRILRPDGSVWVNLGDTPVRGNLVLAPELVALALAHDGWTIRNKITWEKANPRPSSARGRIRDTTEIVLVLTPTNEGGHYYDDWALTEPSDHGGLRRGTDLWRVSATRGDRGGHAAPFSGELARRCITASTSARGCCPACGAQYRRVVACDKPGYVSVAGCRAWKNMRWFETTNWKPTCGCDAGSPIPSTVLDPFAGSGTTLEVAAQLGRRGVGIELNPHYAAGARTRLEAIRRPAEPPDLWLTMGDVPKSGDNGSPVGNGGAPPSDNGGVPAVG